MKRINTSYEAEDEDEAEDEKKTKTERGQAEAEQRPVLAVQSKLATSGPIRVHLSMAAH